MTSQHYSDDPSPNCTPKTNPPTVNTDATPVKCHFHTSKPIVVNTTEKNITETNPKSKTHTNLNNNDDPLKTRSVSLYTNSTKFISSLHPTLN